MSGLNLLDNPYVTVGLLVPGLIVLSVRSQFLTGRRPTHSAALLSYLTVSVIYYALALPVVDFILSFKEPDNSKVLLTWFALIFIGPALLGLLLGVNIQKDLFRRVLQFCGLNPIHVIPTAWDWKFGNSIFQ